jgi:uncharacterized membrane protein
MVGALGIGGCTGWAVGSVVGGRRGATVGALVGASGSALLAFLFAGGLLLQRETLFIVFTLLAALGCGLMAGFFFSFSAVVMRSLAQQPQVSGMATMQTINVAVFNPWFGAAFAGTPVACALVMILALSLWGDPGTAYTFSGAALYVVGTVLVTAVCNVPMNDALAAVTPTDSRAAELWSRYLRDWTAWNHVRTVAPLAATGLLIIGLMRYAGR